MTHSRIRIALVAALLSTTAFAALAPTAEARDLTCPSTDPYCISFEMSRVECYGGAVVPAAGVHCEMGGKEYPLIFCNYCVPFEPRTGVLCYVSNDGTAPTCTVWLPVDVAYDGPNVNCGVIVGPGPAGATCNIEGKTYEVYTCKYCYPAFYVYCVFGTDVEERCGSRGLDAIIA
ncbi:MAG TPA: hypothetical protein VNZ52_00645 [Candidatus Thermoplasmatota archaeon]|nr:hypothetical protein [Candidatus Thermoplasmatota archaeon]